MPSKSSFIPASESKWFIKLFEVYIRNLLWRRFDQLNIYRKYDPGKGRKTIYYLNHNSWWDGLIPFYLNQKIFKQNARGIMDSKQLSRYPFFRKLGVFSIDLVNPRSALSSLRYALESMDRPNASLYIYPQGKIVPFSTDNLTFKNGIGWLAKKCPDVDVVPVGIYIHTLHQDKPRLEISIGEPVQFDRSAETEQINRILEEEISNLLKDLVKRTVQED